MNYDVFAQGPIVGISHDTTHMSYTSLREELDDICELTPSEEERHMKARRSF